MLLQETFQAFRTFVNKVLYLHHHFSEKLLHKSSQAYDLQQHSRSDRAHTTHPPE